MKPARKAVRSFLPSAGPITPASTMPAADPCPASTRYRAPSTSTTGQIPRRPLAMGQIGPPAVPARTARIRASDRRGARAVAAEAGPAEARAAVRAAEAPSPP